MLPRIQTVKWMMAVEPTTLVMTAQWTTAEVMTTAAVMMAERKAKSSRTEPSVAGSNNP